VVFETEPVPAGMLAVGVPAYRLAARGDRAGSGGDPALGVEIRCGVTVGRDISFEPVRGSMPAVILAVGAKSSGLAGTAGRVGAAGVRRRGFAARGFAGRAVPTGREVVVIGGGNVAYDVARTVLRQIAYDTARTAARLPGTAAVRLVSLESLEEMPADTIEIIEGDEEGIERYNGWGPVEILRDGEGAVTGVRFRKCLRVYDEQRRFAPVFDRSGITVPCDTVLLAVGQSPGGLSSKTGGADIEMGRPGWPKADPARWQPRRRASSWRGIWRTGRAC
jgi:formate dehydrogenase beta subunit